MWEGVALGSVEAGDELVVSFGLTMNLNPGKYLLMLAVSDHAAFLVWRENDVIFDHCEIEVYGDKKAWGLVNVPAEVTVRRGRVGSNGEHA